MKISKLLKNKGLTVSTAESCTGGLVSSMLTDISGSSEFIKINFVTYANEAKNKYLNVKWETLEQFGAVSSETAEEMANGLLKQSGCDVALTTTGIAGPNGGSFEKPVGLVYIGVASKNRCVVKKYNALPFLPRTIIKFLFAKRALKLLQEFLEEN